MLIYCAFNKIEYKFLNATKTLKEINNLTVKSFCDKISHKIKFTNDKYGEILMDWINYNHAMIPSTPPNLTPDLKPLNDGSIWHLGGG